MHIVTDDTICRSRRRRKPQLGIYNSKMIKVRRYIYINEMVSMVAKLFYEIEKIDLSLNDKKAINLRYFPNYEDSLINSSFMDKKD